MVEHRNVVNFFAGMDDASRARSAGHLAGGDQPLVRHLGARAVLDAVARLQGGHPTAASAKARGAQAAGDRLQPVLLRQRRRENAARQVRAAARRGQVRGPARLRRGVDAGAALPRVRRPVSRIRRSPAPPWRRSPKRDRPPGGQLRLAAAPPDPDRRGVGGRGQHLRRPRRASRSRPAGSRTTSCCSRTTTPIARTRCFADIEIVRRLWRGEAVRVPGADGKRGRGAHPAAARAEPSCRCGSRPRATRRRFAAGRAPAAATCSPTCSGQNVEQLAEKIAIYRKAWREADIRATAT